MSLPTNNINLSVYFFQMFAEEIVSSVNIWSLIYLRNMNFVGNCHIFPTMFIYIVGKNGFSQRKKKRSSEIIFGDVKQMSSVKLFLPTDHYRQNVNFVGNGWIFSSERFISWIRSPQFLSLTRWRVRWCSCGSKWSSERSFSRILLCLWIKALTTILITYWGRRIAEWVKKTMRHVWRWQFLVRVMRMNVLRSRKNLLL